VEIEEKENEFSQTHVKSNESEKIEPKV